MSFGRSTRSTGRPGSIANKDRLHSCAHCERGMGNFAGGYSRGYNNELLCHPNVSERPDCYKLVTLYNHPTPCDSKTCYEDHADLITYIHDRVNNSNIEKLSKIIKGLK